MSSKIVASRRIFHWVNLVSMVALIISGLYIHHPFASGMMSQMRFLHFVSMDVFGINLMLRVYWAFCGGGGDWAKYLKQSFSKEVLTATFKHYILYQKYPENIKERILQNTSYLLMVFLFAFQIVTGFLLYYPESQTLASTIHFFGGLSLIRSIHFFFMWIFIAFSVVHIYMSLAEEYDNIKTMFFGIE